MNTYVAKSVFVSKTVWFNVLTFVLAVLELSEVINLVPAGWMPYVLAFNGAANLYLRMFTVRPVAVIAPKETKRVMVQTLPSP